jgi:ABC-type lipoprotein export system ATPase subunit
MAVIETRDLIKSYGEGEAQVVALRGVSISIEPGEFVAIMGPSGSGKSTLLTLLGGVETPTSGQVLIQDIDRRDSNGKHPAQPAATGQTPLATVVQPGQSVPRSASAHAGTGTRSGIGTHASMGAGEQAPGPELQHRLVDIATLSDDERTRLRRRRLGFIFQSFNLLPNLSAEENVALPLELDGMPLKAARQRALELLTQVELGGRAGHRPAQLSGGEQQRVAIARALAIRPALLLADEPTGNLDTRQARRVIDLLENLVQEHSQTIVMVTHDRAVAAVASRLIAIRDGLVEYDGAVQEGLARSERVRSREA